MIENKCNKNIKKNRYRPRLTTYAFKRMWYNACIFIHFPIETNSLSHKQGKKTYKLQYFPARARAEHIRMLFAVGGVAFEDVHVQQKDWPALKPSMLDCTYTVID